MEKKSSSVGSSTASVIAIMAIIIAIGAITLLSKNSPDVSTGDSLGEVEVSEVTPVVEDSMDLEMNDEPVTPVQAGGEGDSVVAPLSSFLPSGEVLAGSDVRFIDFNQADYEAALASNQNVVLYFYANWCPSCKQELRNGTLPGFNELSGIHNVIGFRVNYNDNETDDYERGLAKEFGVAYQHTKVFIDKDGDRVLKSPESWSKANYITEITNLANS